MNEADAAFLSQGDSQARLGHGVHGGGDKRDIETDIAGQLRAQLGRMRQDLGVSGKQKNIIERQGFLNDPQHR